MVILILNAHSGLTRVIQEECVVTHVFPWLQGTFECDHGY